MLSTCEADTLFEKIKTETKSGHITALREILPALEGTYSRYEHIDKLPRMYPAVEYTRTREGERRMKQYNGLVQLEVNRLSGRYEAEFVKRQAELLPQTFAAFCGSSGRSVKIWVRFALPDAVPFCLVQPLTMPDEGTFRQRKQDEKNPLARMTPGYETAETFTLMYEAAANLRKPHGNTIREVRRYASFIGTSNQKDLLTDPSGSRRFICIEVTAPIRTNVTINYKQLYAQAMDAVSHGERYWLNDEDEAVLKQTNREFEQVTPLEQLFHCCFRSADSEEDGEWLTAMQIMNYLQTKTKDKLAISKVAQFGRALQKLNRPCRKSYKGTLYHLEKLE